MKKHPIQAETIVRAPRSEVFRFLASLENHWRLADRWIEVLALDGADGGALEAGRVRMRGPLGTRRTARTRVLEVVPPDRLAGEARVGRRTAARVRWELGPAEAEGTAVRLAAEVVEAGPLDRALMALGGRWWMRRRFEGVLDGLAERFAEAPAGLEARPVIEENEEEVAFA